MKLEGLPYKLKRGWKRLIRVIQSRHMSRTLAVVRAFPNRKILPYLLDIDLLASITCNFTTPSNLKWISQASTATFTVTCIHVLTLFFTSSLLLGRKRIAIIGAGPAGLAALKAVLDSEEWKEGYWDVVAFEAREDVGGIW